MMRSVLSPVCFIITGHKKREETPVSCYFICLAYNKIHKTSFIRTSEKIFVDEWAQVAALQLVAIRRSTGNDFIKNLSNVVRCR